MQAASILSTIFAGWANQLMKTTLQCNAYKEIFWGVFQPNSKDILNIGILHFSSSRKQQNNIYLLLVNFLTTIVPTTWTSRHVSLVSPQQMFLITCFCSVFAFFSLTNDHWPSHCKRWVAGRQTCLSGHKLEMEKKLEHKSDKLCNQDLLFKWALNLWNTSYIKTMCVPACTNQLW